MSSKAGSTLATALLSAPLGAIAMMAVFGMPQFSKLSASPEADEFALQQPATAARENRGRPRPHDVFDRYGNTIDAADPELGDGQDPFGAPHDPRGEDPADDAPAWGTRPVSTAFAANESRGRSSGWSRDSGTVAEPPAAESRRESIYGQRPDEGSSWWNEREDARLGQRPPQTAEDPRVTSLTWHGAQRRLSELGVQDFHLERGSSDGLFLFVCQFSPGDDAHITQRFEAEAAEPLSAVSDVVAQIEHWLQRRFSEPPRSMSAQR